MFEDYNKLHCVLNLQIPKSFITVASYITPSSSAKGTNLKHQTCLGWTIWVDYVNFILFLRTVPACRVCWVVLNTLGCVTLPHCPTDHTADTHCCLAQMQYGPQLVSDVTAGAKLQNTHFNASETTLHFRNVRTQSRHTIWFGKLIFPNADSVPHYESFL